MSEKLRYVIDEQGERIGVLLNLEDYQHLINQSPPDSEFLVGLSRAELQALAESVLAPTAQASLADLLTRNAEAQLSPEETAKLDRLLEQIDHLNILKTRAKYTLLHQESLPTAA